MDSIISHDRLGLVNGILKEYNDLKEAIKYRCFKSIIPDNIETFLIMLSYKILWIKFYCSGCINLTEKLN